MSVYAGAWPWCGQLVAFNRPDRDVGSAAWRVGAVWVSSEGSPIARIERSNTRSTPS